MKALERSNRRGRITSLFGTLFPPKRLKRAKKHLTITFVIRGTIPSKKNMIWADSNIFFLKKKLREFKDVQACVDYLEANHKTYMRNSKKYSDWVDAQRPVIANQAASWHAKFEKHGLVFPLQVVSVKVYHYFNDKIERDLTNKMDSINDLLVACGIIQNDSWQHVNRICSEAENYYEEILEPITRIDVTASFF